MKKRHKWSEMMITKFSDGHNKILKYITGLRITWYHLWLDIFTKKMLDGKALRLHTLFILG